MLIEFVAQKDRTHVAHFTILLFSYQLKQQKKTIFAIIVSRTLLQYLWQPSHPPSVIPKESQVCFYNLLACCFSHCDFSLLPLSFLFLFLFFQLVEKRVNDVLGFCIGKTKHIKPVELSEQSVFIKNIFKSTSSGGKLNHAYWDIKY